VIQAEVASSQILRPDMPAGPSVTGSPPWPPAEPVPGDASLGQRSASPWFQSRPPGSADAQPVARPPVAQPPVGPPSPAPALPQRRATQYVHHEPASPEAPQQHAQYGQPSHQQPQTGARHSVWDTGKMTPAPVREAPPAELPRQAPSPREALPPREALAPNQPLPRRQRQASLVPQLRDSGPAPIEELQDGSDGPSPDGSRALVQSLQYGLDLARATPDPEQEWPDTEQSWPTDPWQPTQSWPSGDWPHQSRPDSAASAEDSEGQ
jgi:hypothetical protein